MMAAMMKMFNSTMLQVAEMHRDMMMVIKDNQSVHSSRPLDTAFTGSKTKPKPNISHHSNVFGAARFALA